MNVETATYRLEVSPDGMWADLLSPGGEQWLRLRPHAALDATDGPDETLGIDEPRAAGDGTVEVRRRSTRWDEASVQLVCRDDGVEVRTRVAGRGSLAAVRLLALRSLLPGQAHGLLPSGRRLRTVFSPNPDDPERIERPASETVAIGVVGDSEPGRGRWFFTPAPLYFQLGQVGISLVAPVEELRFPELVYEGGDGAFSLRMEYDGHTAVDGTFDAPALVLTPGVSDPYDGLRAHRALFSSPETRVRPSWWTEPIFCGWGAQCARAIETGERAPALATQDEYDAYLAALENEGVVPGTVVIDDKWQSTYGRNEPDESKWPDLRGWIADRHGRGQKVLLWWKAWDPEGLPPELCIRNGDGEPVAMDPEAARSELRGMLQRMLGRDGLDADGLKIDFTARTPSGAGLTTSSGSWGIALLRELLRIVYTAAKEAKPDALIVTHTPHPSFVDVTDMIRLNDMIRIGDGTAPQSVVPQMRHRAAVVHAVCPELLVDTDDWCVPSLAAWREYLVEKPLLGVPALYYAQKLDGAGERLGPEDYRALRETWAAWRDGRNERRPDS
jgi:hypothetical protein